MNNTINVVCCGYRSWAINIINEIEKNSRINIVHIFNSKNDYDSKIENINSKIDIIIFLGWSWIIPKEITNKYLCVGIHPSNLPNYRGGSPIQHQIINGVIKTKISLFTISEKVDGGDIWLKNDVNLSGQNIESIFKNIENSSISLLNNFFNLYPNISPIKQDLTKGSYFKRRTPEHSRLELDVFNNKSLEEIYNTIRCLTDPYPNAFIEDEYGNKLLFKEVQFVPFTKESD